MNFLIKYILLLFGVWSNWINCTSSNFNLLTTESILQQSLAFKYLEETEQLQVQEEILDVLGLDHRPKPKRHVLEESAPQYLMDLYTNYLDPESGDLRIDTEHNSTVFNQTKFDINESDTIMSFVNQIKTQRHNKHLRHNRDRRFWFNISDVSNDVHLFDAELRLFRNLNRSRLNSSYDLDLTLYQLSYGMNREEVVMNFVNTIHIDGHVDGWLRFNVTQSLDDWLRYSNQNLGLYLQIRTTKIAKDLSPKSVGIVNSRGNKKYQPFMTAYFKSKYSSLLYKTTDSKVNRAGRGKRATAKKRSDVSYYDHDVANPFLSETTQERYSSGRDCQKRALYVSFKELNWQDWVIAPEGYAAFFCDGECSFPMNKQMNATNHAIMQQLIHIMNPYTVPKPCCAPRQLSSIMVLFFDDNSNVVLKKFKNMVVKSCGCH